MPRARIRTATAILSLALIGSLLPLAAGPAAASPVVPVDSNGPVGCDPIDPAACLLPFPNDFFTTPDATKDTGLRVNFLPNAMPRNGTEVTEGGEGKPVDPTEWNRNDGWSPGSMVMTYVPGLDLHKTWGTENRPYSQVGINEPGYFDHRDQIADIGLYQRPDAPIVIINTETGERHPFWSELDLHPGAEGERVLIMRPAVNFAEGTRYVIGLRNLKASDGSTIATPAAFGAYVSGDGADAARQADYDQNVFPVLEADGVAKDDLYLAWDFTIASERNLAERALHMRDDAFGRILGDTNLADGIVQGKSPAFKIHEVSTGTDNWTDSRGNRRSLDLRYVDGTVTVPNYLDRVQQARSRTPAGEKPEFPEPVPGEFNDGMDELPEEAWGDFPTPGSRLLDTDLDGLPNQNPVESTVEVPFRCRLALNGKEQNGTLYGHGLLGMRNQINDIKSPQRNGPFFGCAADWWGMSTPDLPTVVAILTDLSNFPSLPDRAQQGFLNFMFLGRAMVHKDGFATDPAFQQDGKSLVNVADDKGTPLYYDGNSQGGIMGGALVALSPDIQRGILGVPGMNYSTLLNRSVDWEGEFDPTETDPTDPESALPPYSTPYYNSYRDPIERQLGFALIQMLWDRGEANGFAHHMTSDPYENTPKHDVMLQVAWSDHQVANVAAEVEARTIGAPIMTPGLPEGLHWEKDPYFTDTAKYPYKGSSLVYWDSGNATPPNGNVPPEHGTDPHGHGRNEPAAGWQEAQFLLTGWNVDVCQGGDYLTLKHPDNNGTPSCKEPTFPAGSRVPHTKTKLTFTPSTPASGDHTDQATFSAKLTDEVGNAVGGEALAFTFAGKTLGATTDNDGIASVTTTLTESPGAYTVSVAHAENEWFEASSASTPFTVTKEDTVLRLTDASATSGDYSDSATFEARLAEDGGALEGRGVTFTFAGQKFAATTDSNGIARVTTTLSQDPGTYPIGVSYAGNSLFEGSSDAGSLQVTKEDSKLDLVVHGNGRRRALIATLTDFDSGAGIGGRAVRFFGDGELIGTATTDADGVARLLAPNGFRGGHIRFEARFVGDRYFLASKDNFTT